MRAPFRCLLPILLLTCPWIASPALAQTGVRPADDDGDGIPNVRDKCPGQAEDLDGFNDQDGCPDPDNDQDGVADQDDRCPMLPEDLDGFADQDGCPDPDDDQDGVPDRFDGCPREPGPGRLNGCPPARDAHLPLVLVYDVHDPAGTTNRQSLDRVADRLSARFAQQAGYRQVPRRKLHLILLEEKTGEYRTCWDQRCQRYLGGRLAAHKIIGSRLERTDGICTLRAQVMDVADGSTTSSASGQGACTPEALLTTAQAVADALGALGDGG